MAGGLVVYHMMSENCLNRQSDAKKLESRLCGSFCEILAGGLAAYHMISENYPNRQSGAKKVGSRVLRVVNRGRFRVLCDRWKLPE